MNTPILNSDSSSNSSGSEEETGPQILIIDDFEQSSNVLRDSLQFCRSADCTIAVSGENALQLLEERGAFDLILTDVYMPGMGGIAFVKAVRAMEQSKQWRPQIIVSMSAEENKAAECLAAGSTLFLFKLDNPIKHIFKLLDHLQVQKENRVEAKRRHTM